MKRIIGFLRTSLVFSCMACIAPVEANTMRFEFSGVWAELGCMAPGEGVCALVGTPFSGSVQFAGSGLDTRPLDGSYGWYEFQPSEFSFVLDNANDAFDFDLHDILDVVVDVRVSPASVYVGDYFDRFSIVFYFAYIYDLTSDEIPTLDQLMGGESLGILLREHDDSGELCSFDYCSAINATTPSGNFSVQGSFVPLPASFPLLVAGGLFIGTFARRGVRFRCR